MGSDVVGVCIYDYFWVSMKIKEYLRREKNVEDSYYNKFCELKGRYL